MKLYAWQPIGHGELSFFVMAEDETRARTAVNRKIAWLTHAGDRDHTRGWGTAYYTLTVAEAGEVLTNDNG